ncbi:MAG: ParA family protein [Alphaproteobacteria bacterium]|nr:ParA family protein [Alphaproteobacteria bacterium]
MATVITVAQQKGGAGKTTLTAQLAVTFARNFGKVALIDIDPQGSLGAWFKIRQDALGEAAGGMHLSGIPGWRLGTELDRLHRKFDYIVIDSPPHAETDSRAAIRSGDLVVVPVQPSPLDLWATAPTLALAQKEKRPLLLVINRMPPRGNLPEAVLAKLAVEPTPMAATRLGNRMAYAASMMEGKGVIEIDPSSTAAKEITALAHEIATCLGKKA